MKKKLINIRFMCPYSRNYNNHFLVLYNASSSQFFSTRDICEFVEKWIQKWEQKKKLALHKIEF